MIVAEQEWWINNVQQNMLTGIPDDSNNPAKLPNATILEFLTKIQAARESFQRIVPTLLPEEQTRLQPIFDQAVVLSKDIDKKQFFDRIQSNWNKTGIRTAGPKGGTRIGGNQ